MKKNIATVSMIITCMILFGSSGSISYASHNSDLSIKSNSLYYVTTNSNPLNPPAVTVATDGSGDFNCDGASDQVEINQAIDFVANNADFTIVYLKGPATYTLDEPILMQSNVTLTGDSTTKVQLKDLAGWWTKYKPLISQKDAEWDPWGHESDFLSNVEIYGFELSGGIQTEPTGDNYIPLIHFMNPSNITIHDMYLHNSRWDIIRLTGSDFNTSIKSKVYNNLIMYSGHEGICFVGVTDFEAYNNEIYITRTNCGIRVKDGDHFSLHGNTIGNSLTNNPSGYAGILVENSHVPIGDAEIYENFIYGKCGGINLNGYDGVYPTGSRQGVHIHHNRIYKSRNRVAYYTDGSITPLDGGIRINGFDNTIIEYNIIEGGDKDGIVYEGSAGGESGYQTIVRNNIIANNKGYGLNNLESGVHSFVSEYNDVFNNAKGEYNNVFSTTDIHTDPLYAHPSLKPGWHSVVGTYDSETEIIKIYVDGEEKASEQYPGFGRIDRNDNYVYLGSYNGVGYWLDGRLDEVAVWDRTLSNEEISSIWNEGKGAFIGSTLTTNLKAYWQMENNWIDSYGDYDGFESSTANFTVNAKLGDYAGLFDHTYAVFPHTLSPSSAITVAAWVYRDEKSITQDVIEQTIFSKGSQGHNDHIWLYCKGDNFYFEVGNGASRIDISSPGVTADELDFHLQSEYGRWNGLEWVFDNITSPCINSGDPEMEYSREPSPNGGRVNIGVYGNTIEASKGDDKPVADTGGSYIGFIDNPVMFTGFVYRGYPPYSYQWDFGDATSDVGKEVSHRYSETGNFTVTLTVTDAKSRVAVDTTWVLIYDSNNPPSTPYIEGETKGHYWEEYFYGFYSVDSDGHSIKYYVDWGDGKYEDWIGPYDSGEEVILSHIWGNSGRYVIRVKAKDTLGFESEWATFEISMPKNKINSNSSFLQFFEKHLQFFPLLQKLLRL